MIQETPPKKISVNGWLCICAFFFALLFPLTCSIYPNIFGFVKSSVVLLIGLFIAILIILYKKEIRITKPQGLVIIFAGIIILDMCIRGSENNARLLQYCIIFVFALALSQNDEWILPIISLFEYIGLFYSITVIIQCFFPNAFNAWAINFFSGSFKDNFVDLYQWGYCCGLTTQASIICCYIGMGVCACFSTIVPNIAANKKVPIRKIVELIIMFASSLFIGKRAGVILIAFSVTLVFGLIKINPGKKFKFLIAVLSCMVLFYIIVVPIMENANLSFFTTIQRFLDYAHSPDMSNGRWDNISKGIVILAEHPFIGIGWENYMFYTGSRFNCHNIYVQLLCEFGIIIGPLLIAILVLSWVQIKKFFSISIDTQNNKLMIYSSFSLLLQTFILGYGFFENAIYDVESVGAFTVALCVSCAISNSVNKQ